MSEHQNPAPRPRPTDGEPSAPSLESLHQEIILSHHRRPRNRREVEDPSVRVQVNNPACGDEIVLSLRLDGDRVADVGFTGQGCAISQSSASMMTVLLEGRTLEEAQQLAAAFGALVHGQATPAQTRQLGDLRALAGVAKFPVRVRCAMLAWNALEQARGELAGRSDPDSAP